MATTKSTEHSSAHPTDNPQAAARQDSESVGRATQASAARQEQKSRVASAGHQIGADPTDAQPPAKESLREQKKARARASILQAAARLISIEGYAQTKMRDVAQAADMSYQTLYNYFPTKGLILQELLTRDLLKLHRATVHTLSSGDHLAAKLRELAKSYIDAIAPDDRHLWKEVCAELLKVTSHHSSLLALLDEQAHKKLQELFNGAQTNGELDPHIDATILADVVFSLLDSTLMRYLVNENLTRPTMLSAISAQLRITITPYLLSAN